MLYKLANRISNQITNRDFRRLRGATGTELFSGVISGEDENKIWADQQRAVKEADMMRKSDARMRQADLLLMTPILSATMSISPATDRNVDVRIAQFVEQQLFRSDFFRWHDVLRQQLTYFAFGHSVMEKAYFPRNGEEMLGRIEFRKPQTLFTWKTENGILTEVGQQAALGDDMKPKKENMFAEQVILTVYEQEGLNFNGRSALRPAWWAWKYKQRLMALEVQKFQRLAGIPHIKAKTQDIPDEAKDVAEKIYLNEQAYIISTPSYEMDIFGLGSGGQGQGISALEMIKFLDHQIIFSVLGNFMTKGEDKVGSFALTEINADMFFKNEEREANHVENVWNEPDGRMENISQMVKRNFPNVTEFPKLRIEKLALDDLGGFAEQAAKLAAAGLLVPDRALRNFVRKRYDLPNEEIDDAGRVQDMQTAQPTLKFIDSGRPPVVNQNKRGKLVTPEQIEFENQVLDKDGISEKLDRTRDELFEEVSFLKDELVSELVERGRKVLRAGKDVRDVKEMIDKTPVPNRTKIVNAIVRKSKDQFRFGMETVKEEIERQKNVK